MSSQTPQDFEHLLERLAPNIGEAGDLPTYLRRILAAAYSFFAPDLVSIAAINPITEQFILPLEFLGEQRAAERFQAVSPRPHGIARQAIDQGALFVDDVTQQPGSQSPFIEAEGVQAYAAVALVTPHEREPLAVLFIDYRQPRRLTNHERDLLRMLAAQAGVLLQQGWLLHRYAEVTRIGREINQELSSVDALFHKLAGLVGEIIESEHFFLLATHQRQTDQLDLYVREQGRDVFYPNEPISGGCRWVIEHQQPLLIQHRSHESLPTDLTLDPLPGLVNAEEALLYVPLALRGVSFGVLSVQHTRPHAYDAEDQRVLELLSNHVALGLSNIRLFDNLAQLNQVGQFLTSQLDSEQVLHDVVAYIRSAARADIVILYPYDRRTDQFDQPRTDGRLIAPEHPQAINSRDDHIATLTVARPEPVFAKDSRTLYGKLGGDEQARQGFSNSAKGCAQRRRCHCG